MTDSTPAAPGAATNEPADDTPEQLRIRRDKRQRLLDSGVQAYPVEVPRTHGLAEIASDPRFAALEPGEETDVEVSVAGRVLFVRNTGKLCFVRLQDGVHPGADLSTPAADGGPDAFAPQLQAMLSLANVGEERLEAWKQDVDLGDHVSVTGRVVRSKRGELSVMADAWVLAAKSLRPLPVAHKDLSEDTRVRQRYTDLIMRDTARRNAVTRIRVVRALRTALEARGFLEVETPMLQTLHGGAAARPFVTHSNALDLDLYLRIAPELYLKRCVVGGIERVFEINRNFRNEGVDSSHSPEFAMLETYQAYGDYDTSATMIREVIQEVAREVYGSTTVTLADGTDFDLGGRWPELRMYPSLNEALRAKHPHLTAEVTVDSTVEELLALAGGVGLEVPSGKGWLHGKLVEELWEHLCGDQLEGPVFVRDFPVETSPLTRDHRTERGVTEKWDLYVRGFELATGYSELVDPVIQRRRFEDQARLAAAGESNTIAVTPEASFSSCAWPTLRPGTSVMRLRRVMPRTFLRRAHPVKRKARPQGRASASIRGSKSVLGDDRSRRAEAIVHAELDAMDVAGTGLRAVVHEQAGEAILAVDRPVRGDLVLEAGANVVANAVIGDAGDLQAGDAHVDRAVAETAHGVGEQRRAERIAGAEVGVEVPLRAHAGRADRVGALGPAIGAVEHHADDPRAGDLPVVAGAQADRGALHLRRRILEPVVAAVEADVAAGPAGEHRRGDGRIDRRAARRQVGGDGGGGESGEHGGGRDDFLHFD